MGKRYAVGQTFTETSNGREIQSIKRASFFVYDTVARREVASFATNGEARERARSLNAGERLSVYSTTLDGERTYCGTFVRADAEAHADNLRALMVDQHGRPTTVTTEVEQD